MMGTAVAERHAQDVRAIVDGLRAQRRIVEWVIDLAFEMALRRGETTSADRFAFEDWSRTVIAKAQKGTVPTGLWSAELSSLLESYLAIAVAPDTVAGNVAGRAAAADDGTLGDSEQVIADLVAGVLIGSVTMWSTGDPQAKKAPGIDKSQVVRADVMGAITGAAGAAVATWWSGPATTGAVAGATVTGAVLGSAVDAVSQDTASDAIEQDEPEK